MKEFIRLTSPGLSAHSQLTLRPLRPLTPAAAPCSTPPSSGWKLNDHADSCGGEKEEEEEAEAEAKTEEE